MLRKLSLCVCKYRTFKCFPQSRCVYCEWHNKLIGFCLPVHAGQHQGHFYSTVRSEEIFKDELNEKIIFSTVTFKKTFYEGKRIKRLQEKLRKAEIEEPCIPVSLKYITQSEEQINSKSRGVPEEKSSDYVINLPYRSKLEKIFPLTREEGELSEISGAEQDWNDDFRGSVVDRMYHLLEIYSSIVVHIY